MTTVPQGSDCWMKSSFSPNGSDCVEIRMSDLFAVRDSKNPESVLAGVNVRALVTALRSGLLG